MYGVGRVGNTGEAARALDLDAVVEDLNADVVAADAVGAVHDGVHDGFEPGILQDEPDVLEASATSERAASRQLLEQLLACLGQLVGNRPFDALVVQELLSGAGAPLGFPVPKDANVAAVRNRTSTLGPRGQALLRSNRWSLLRSSRACPPTADGRARACSAATVDMHVLQNLE
jgi:hypothetical protein